MDDDPLNSYTEYFKAYQKECVDIAPRHRLGRILHEADHQVEQDGAGKARAVLPKLERTDGKKFPPKAGIKQPHQPHPRRWCCRRDGARLCRRRLPLAVKLVTGRVHSQLIRQVEEIVGAGQPAMVTTTLTLRDQLVDPDEEKTIYTSRSVLVGQGSLAGSLYMTSLPESEH